MPKKNTKRILEPRGSQTTGETKK